MGDVEAKRDIVTRQDLRHTVSPLTDHLVSSPKYRGKVLEGEVAEAAEEKLLVKEWNNVVKSLKTTSNTVNTAFVERFMLTLRQCLCSLHRKTPAAVKTREELVAQITLFHVFCNFIRPHTSLTMGKGREKQKRTPAIILMSYDDKELQLSNFMRKVD